MKKNPETELQRLLPRVIKAMVKDKKNTGKHALELGMCIAYAGCLIKPIDITFDKGCGTENTVTYYPKDLIEDLRNVATQCNLFSIDYDIKKKTNAPKIFGYINLTLVDE